MAVKRGDIVLAVHADLGKPRPAVVVQADMFNENALTILVCPLTSDIAERLPLRPIVPAGPDTGLRERSQIMTDKMLALRSDRIRGVLGSIDASTGDQLDRALLIVLGLAH
ncbi:MAG TPA: type II toxin-antitoxin system PemK/MazF family toxin [Pseudolabrys sp.]|nr:type II toxin-antitoxin system PemK/MazF family toxin [Pseudolabrys sp.]